MTEGPQTAPSEAPVVGRPPAVDVIILAWGRIDDTCAAIDSALGQRGVEVRLIVVDQGTEESEFGRLATFCSERQGVVLIRNEENAGVPGGRNQGAAEGVAPFIVSLDNDAEFATPDELARAVGRFIAVPRLGALGFRIRLFSQDADDASSWSYPKPLSAASTPFLAERFVGAGHMIRRTAFEAAGGYDPTLVFMHEESELAYKCLIGN